MMHNSASTPEKQSEPTPRLSTRSLRLVLAAIVFSGLWLAYAAQQQRVYLLVNNQTFQLGTHRLDVETILLQNRVSLREEDILRPATGPIDPTNPQLRLQLARPIIIDETDGPPRTFFTHATTPAEVYTELNIALDPADDIYVDGQLWQPNQTLPNRLPPPPPRQATLPTRIETQRPLPLRLTLHQAIPVHLEVDGQRETIFSTAQTVGDIILGRDIPVYHGDALTPDFGTLLEAEMVIRLERSVPVQIEVDGRTLHTRTRHQTIGELFSQEQIRLQGQDYSVPAEENPIVANQEITVVRVAEAVVIDEERRSFETEWWPNPELELDQQEIAQTGQDGVTKTRTRLRFENGQLVESLEEERWLDQDAANRIIRYGTRVVVRQTDTPNGEISYWRKIRMLATSYSAATSGKSPDHPAYGITRTGMPAGYGVVAVDPSVVALRSQLYIPDYGPAIAGDTGGRIIGKHVDLGFDEDQPPLWYRWVDVYLLTPPPPADQIRYVLPPFPQE